MLRPTLTRRISPPQRGGFLAGLFESAQEYIHKYVPDPRRDPMTKRPVGYEDFKHDTAAIIGQEKLREGETIEDYMKKRDAKWAERMKIPKEMIEATGHPTRPDGSLFIPGETRETYMNIEDSTKLGVVEQQRRQQIDDEKVKLRRQLQVENEGDYRKFIAETKRIQMKEQETLKKRLPHAADPKYDPFKATPGYRPQDSKRLGLWLKQQRESGQTASGIPLDTKTGQERFYNEEKMATQYFANPFASRIEVPAGLPKMMVTGMSPDSFFIQDKEVIGSVIVTPTRYYHWNASEFEDINEKSLSLLLHIYPVPDVVFIGTGRNLHFIDEELRIKFLKRGTVVHCLTTKNAASEFGLQLSIRRRMCCALLPCIPTNSYKTECFGDFVDNDAFCYSDTELGIRAPRQCNPTLYRQNDAAEKYRHMQGTGIGPKYHMLPDGRMVRPGTSGTKLRPLVEPGEDIEWEKLPSYYHWFPKERLEDYIENTTWREIAGKPMGDPAEKRMRQILTADQPQPALEQPKADVMPWDSESIPMMKWPHERDPENISVEDPKTGRIVGMRAPTFEKWKQMMKDRKEGKKPSVEIEFDQETIVSDQNGRLVDLTKTRYIPMYEGRFHPQRPSKTGRGNLKLQS